MKNPYGDEYRAKVGYKDKSRDVFSAIGQGKVIVGGKEIDVYKETGAKPISERVGGTTGNEFGIDISFVTKVNTQAEKDIRQQAHQAPKKAVANVIQPIEEVSRALGLSNASNDKASGAAAGDDTRSWWDSLRAWVSINEGIEDHEDKIGELESTKAKIEELNKKIQVNKSKGNREEVLFLNKQKQELVRSALRQANTLLLKAEALAKENPNAAKALAYACEGAFLALTPMLYVGSKALEYGFGEELSEYFDKKVARPILAQAGIKPGDEEYHAGKLVLETMGALATFKAHNVAVNKIAKATSAASKVATKEAHVISQIEVEGSILKQAHTDVESILEHHTVKAKYTTKEWVESKTSVVKSDLDLKGKSYSHNAEFLKQVENWPAAKIAAEKIPAEMGIAQYATGSNTTGLKWSDNSTSHIRINHAKPNAKFDCQKVDYVKIVYENQVIDRQGHYLIKDSNTGRFCQKNRFTGEKKYLPNNPSKPIPDGLGDHPDAHIPLKEWLKWKKWNEK
jgi:hypothetical protein